MNLAFGDFRYVRLRSLKLTPVDADASVMADDLIPATQGQPLGTCELNKADLALLGAHVEDIGQAYAAQIAAAVSEPDADDAFTDAVCRYFESLFSGVYDPTDRELPNQSPSAWVKIHEVAIAAIIKAHRRNETKLYQTLMAYLRVSQADMASAAEQVRTARPHSVRSA